MSGLFWRLLGLLSIGREARPTVVDFKVRSSNKVLQIMHSMTGSDWDNSAWLSLAGYGCVMAAKWLASKYFQR